MCLLLSWLISFTGPTNVCGAEGDEFFETSVRPLLVKHCLDCHGAQKQESGLRLDSKAGWQKGGDNGTAIVPGHPDKSLFIKAIRYDDPNLQMPPDGKKLAAADIALLVEWVKQGAPDPREPTSAENTTAMSLAEAREFWSFQPIQLPQVAKVKNSRWARNPIDSFVLAELETKRLAPNQRAAKLTLIRRATFDLTGLPPTPDEINAFLEDTSKDALATLVNRLLNSPAYGERWGRHWLDVARYADTAGDGADYPVREAGMYRNWVINAFNKDQPFDQFVREQIAGDVLAQSGPADQYADRVTATGFLAIGKRYGYAPTPDYQHLDFADVIDSVGRSLLGLSIGCARCHDHKYDPISAADYYALYGIMQSTKWAFPGGETHKGPIHFPALVPATEVARLEKSKAEQLAKLDTQLARLKQEQSLLNGQSFAGGEDLNFEAQPLDKPPGKPWFSAGPINVLADAQSPFVHVHPTGNRGIQIGSGKPADGLRYVFERGLKAVPGKQIHFTTDFRNVVPAAKPGAYRFYLGRGVIQSLAVECSVTATDFAIRNGKQWEVIRQLKPGSWYTLQLTLDHEKKSYSGILSDGQEETKFHNKQTGPGWDGVADTFICDGFGHVAGAACVRQLDNIGMREVPFKKPNDGPVSAPVQTAKSKARLLELKSELNRLTAQRKVDAAQPAVPVAYGVAEGSPTNAHIQKRGEPSKLGDEVPRRFLQVLGGDLVPASSSGSGRLQLANWLTRPTNPLTARVFVNRVWQWHFGQGLVTTPSDFGVRGTPPSHPELLDWLTAKFIASGWSVKSLHRLIMASNTYQLSSADNSTNLNVDPSNRWLWRFSRRPLDAESIRDSMLAVSGNLDRAVPTSHPFPPVKSWGFTIHRPFHAVYDSNHRSVYLMVQRNRRHPYLALFDAADPNQSVAARKPTTTPTQTLFLMNSSFVHQQAEAFAKRLISDSESAETRVRQAFKMAHGHTPSANRIADAVDFVAAYQVKLAESKQSGEAGKLAAWSAFARVLLTSNGFLYVD